MAEKDACQYLGHPSGGLFYYQKKSTGEILFVETNDEVDAFVSGELDRCPRFAVLDDHRPIFIGARAVGVGSVALHGNLPHSTMEHGEQHTGVPIADIEWLLERRYVKPSQIQFGEGLAEFRHFWKTLFEQIAISVFGEDE